MSARRNGAADRTDELCPQCVSLCHVATALPLYACKLTMPDRAIIVLLQQMAPFPRDIEREVESVSSLSMQPMQE